MNNDIEQIFILNAGQSQPSDSTHKLVDVDVPGASQVNLETVEDFSNVCRTCATITEFVIPIFSGEGLQNNLADKIHKHLPIQVSCMDVLPRVVCYQCASTLLAWHELVQCCQQADAALRARLQQQEKTENQKSISNIEEENQSKFDAIPEYVVPPREPPKYPEPDPPEPAVVTPEQPVPPQSPSRACDYCDSTHGTHTYQEHLVTKHAELLFHCEECDKYIDRKDFILHMSLHAVQYTAGQDNKDTKKKKVRKKKEDIDVNQNSNKVTNIQPDSISEPPIVPPMNNSNNKDNNQPNEFSDHSDMEYGFGPLPESVFEAIEDSQDSQPVEENGEHVLDNDGTSEGSNKPVESAENSNLTEAVPVTEDHSNISNFAVDGSNLSNPAPETNINNCVASSDSAKSIKSYKKPRTCPYCGKVYTASSSYFYHIKHTHKTSKDHECEVCGRRFSSKACLLEHVTVHTGENKYECKECQKRFRTKASLYIHSQVHGGTKAWTCGVCARSFRWRTHLVRHARRHAADRPHVCVTCGRAFSVRCDLLRHARTHFAGQHLCTHCGLNFAQPRYLRAHIEKKHSTKDISNDQKQPEITAAEPSTGL